MSRLGWSDSPEVHPDTSRLDTIRMYTSNSQIHCELGHVMSNADAVTLVYLLTNHFKLQ